jgi:hypothetical protein
MIVVITNLLTFPARIPHGTFRVDIYESSIKDFVFDRDEGRELTNDNVNERNPRTVYRMAAFAPARKAEHARAAGDSK